MCLLVSRYSAIQQETMGQRSHLTISMTEKQSFLGRGEKKGGLCRQTRRLFWDPTPSHSSMPPCWRQQRLRTHAATELMGPNIRLEQTQGLSECGVLALSSMIIVPPPLSPHWRSSRLAHSHPAACTRPHHLSRSHSLQAQIHPVQPHC